MKGDKTSTVYDKLIGQLKRKVIGQATRHVILFLVVDAMATLRSYVLSLSLPLKRRTATCVILLRDKPSKSLAVTCSEDVVGLVVGIADLCEDLNDDQVRICCI